MKNYEIQILRNIVNPGKRFEIIKKTKLKDYDGVLGSCYDAT